MQEMSLVAGATLLNGIGHLVSWIHGGPVAVTKKCDLDLVGGLELIFVIICIYLLIMGLIIGLIIGLIMGLLVGGDWNHGILNDFPYTHIFQRG
jgi:hypothetical protein